MSSELINRITIKKDGIYISSHSSNDDRPYHSVKFDSLTNIYNQEGQKGLDREVIDMLYNYAELRGSHHSLKRYFYACNSKYAKKVIKEYSDKQNYSYAKLSDEDKKSYWTLNQTENAKNCSLYIKALDKEMYSKIAKKCEEYDLINSLMLDNQNSESFSYYENIIDKILDISDEYDVDFDRNCPFEDFGSDEESYTNTSFSNYYKDILEKFDIKDVNISTINFSDGKYKLIINNQEFKITAWDNLESVVSNINLMIEKYKSKDIEMEV